MDNLNNTRNNGRARIFIYKDNDKFVGVCLEFDLVVCGKTQLITCQLLLEMVKGYVQNAWENNLPDSVLNRPAPKKYWNVYNKFIENQRPNKTFTSSNEIRSARIATLIENGYQNGKLYV